RHGHSLITANLLSTINKGTTPYAEQTSCTATPIPVPCMFVPSLLLPVQKKVQLGARVTSHAGKRVWAQICHPAQSWSPRPTSRSANPGTSRDRKDQIIQRTKTLLRGKSRRKWL